MSRFVNLEFGDQHEEEQPSQQEFKGEAHYFAQAQEAFEKGDFEGALRRFSRVLEFNPENTHAWTGQVRMLIELGEYREARLWADKALERFPHEPELLAAKSVALARAGDVREAMAYSDASIEERGDTPYIWLARGDVLLASEEKRADYCFDKAMQLSPRNWFLHWLVSRIYSFYEKYSLAFKHAKESLNLDAARSVVWLQSGHCQLALGMAALARCSYSRARELDPHSEEVNRAFIEMARSGWWRRLRSRVKHWFIE